MSNKYQSPPENMQQDRDGLWRAAVPLPFYGIRKGCHCGKKFWRESSYEAHYIEAHTDGIRYKRSPTGFHAIERIHGLPLIEDVELPKYSAIYRKDK